LVGAVIAMLWPRAEPEAPIEPTSRAPVPVEPTEPEPTEPTEVVAPSTPAEPARVLVTVTSEPSGAEVMSGGVLIGTTPVTHPFPPTTGGARRVFELTLAGHRSARVSERLEGEAAEVHVRFEPETVPEPGRPTMREPVARPREEASMQQAVVMQAESMAATTTEATMDTTPEPTPMSNIVRDTPRVPIVD
jgi:hypothetical protein